ncbi:MAG: rubrerythrin family protein [Candidatus Gastranaerophilales bacterium]|nr:rubrerythrin family protein [Candidatus Gastranaerophilales bacterium]
MTEFEGSKTQENLEKAFCAESKARNKYTYFSSVAKKEGYNQIAQIFEETANNEKEHAKVWFKLLSGIKNTEKNLEDSIKNEHYEWSEMYVEYANTAQKEGFLDIAKLFREILSIEKSHEERYQKLLDNIKENKVFKDTKKNYWHCANCGYIHYGMNAPEICPFCKHPQSYFERKADNY